MKKQSLLLLAGIGLLMLNSGKLLAQSTTATTTLNVRLKPIMNIIIADAQVKMVFATGDDYANGISVSKVDHLTVNSTNGFQVTVESDGDLTKSGGTEIIPIGDFSVTAANGTSHAFTGSYIPTFNSDVALSTSPSQIMTSDDGISIGSISVDYKAKGGSNFVTTTTNPLVDESIEHGTTYTAKLTYTILAD